MIEVARMIDIFKLYFIIFAGKPFNLNIDARVEKDFYQQQYF